MAVFPAHAGMSLRITNTNFFQGCFPRSRGDEPTSLMPHSTRARFSPLTRG